LWKVPFSRTRESQSLTSEAGGLSQSHQSCVILQGARTDSSCSYGSSHPSASAMHRCQLTRKRNSSVYPLLTHPQRQVCCGSFPQGTLPKKVWRETMPSDSCILLSLASASTSAEKKIYQNPATNNSLSIPGGHYPALSLPSRHTA
jgi:hypothetical protein